MGLWTKGCLLWCQLSRLQTLSKLHRRRVDTWVCHGMITSILMSVQYIYIYYYLWITFGIYQLQPLQGLCQHRQGEGSASSQARIEGRDVGGLPWLEDTLPPTWHIYQWFGFQPQPWSQSEPLLAIHQKSWSFPVVQGSFQTPNALWFDFISSQIKLFYFPNRLPTKSKSNYLWKFNENTYIPIPFMPPMHCSLRTYLSMMTPLVIHGHQ